MTILQKLGAFIALLLIVAATGYFTGRSHVQKAWDLEKARVSEVAKQEQIRNSANLYALKSKYKKELDHEKDAAYSRGIRDFLNSRSLLPNSPSSGEAKVPSGINGTACESGLTERITELAKRCVSDARRVEMCTEWAIREGLEVE